MTIYPAIDIRGGRCVRLQQGKASEETVHAEDPAAVAQCFSETGARWVHVVDLDGAFGGHPANVEKVRTIASTGLQVQLGGGLRTRADVDAALALGVRRVVIGTRAAESPGFIRELVDAHGDRIAVGIDARDGHVAVRGWVEVTGLDAVELARRIDGIGVSTIIYTDIATDGMLTGPNFAAQEALCGAVHCRVIASGGVAALSDVRRFAAMAARIPNLDGVIIGKALYAGRLTLADALAV